MPDDFLTYKLPSQLYRRFLMLTAAWEGVRAGPGSLLVRCNSGGNGLPLFWSGTPDTLVSFNEVLGQERPIYCLSGTHGVLPPSEETIRALARYYVGEIIKVQPKGPYLLGGYCEAGLISYEIAKILLEHDYEVGMLFLFDRDITETDAWIKLARRLFLMIEMVFYRWEQVRENPVQCVKEILLNKWQQLVVFPVQYVKNKLGFVTVEQSAEILEYKLTPYPGKIKLMYVRCGLLGYFQFSFFQRYWRKLVLDEIDYQFIPGTTHNKPNWTMVAQSLQSFIKKEGV